MERCLPRQAIVLGEKIVWWPYDPIWITLSNEISLPLSNLWVLVLHVHVPLMFGFNMAVKNVKIWIKKYFLMYICFW